MAFQCFCKISYVGNYCCPSIVMLRPALKLLLLLTLSILTQVENIAVVCTLKGLNCTTIARFEHKTAGMMAYLISQISDL